MGTEIRVKKKTGTQPFECPKIVLMKFTFRNRTNQMGIKIAVNTEMPFHSIFNSAEEITCSRHVSINRLLLAQSALDILHLTRYFQRK